jgi:pyrroloquinoline quinone (PQQ) biosynthesis protein C
MASRGSLEKSYFGRRLTPEQADAVVGELRALLLDLTDRWLLKGRFHRDLDAGRLPLEAIRVFWQNWYGFVAEINNLHGCAYQRHLPFFKRHPELQGHFASHVADELTHPKPPGHIRIVLEQGRVFGLADEEMIDYEMLPECRAFLEYYRGLLYEGTMAEWWASFCVEEGVGHWARFFGNALRKAYRMSDSEIVYFTVHSKADLEPHDGVMGHADLDWMVLKKILEEGRAETRPGFSLEYCIRTGTAYFAWFFEGVYQFVHREGLYAP